MEAIKVSPTRREKLQRLRNKQKVFGVPRLPWRIDAMYDNVCEGNLMAYYLDGDPIRQDPVFLKLREIAPVGLFVTDASGSEKVAWQYQSDMHARKMDERTYNHIKRMPLWALKLEYSIKHETDKSLRRRIANEFHYMYRDERKQWIDLE